MNTTIASEVATEKWYQYATRFLCSSKHTAGIDSAVGTRSSVACT